MNIDKEILNWTLVSYGKIIRGDEDTSEDQVASAVTIEMAALLVNRFNEYKSMEKILNEIKDWDINNKMEQGQFLLSQELREKIQTLIET